MQNLRGELFKTIVAKRPNRNNFNLSHDVKTSTKFGYITPVMLMDCVPGDKIRLGAETLLRFAPMIAPVMDQFNLYVHYFFVPNRLLWDKWPEWISGESLDAHPFVNIDGADSDVGTLANYLFIPPATGGNSEQVSAFPFSAYQCVYNEYYRDQNLINPVPFECVDGNNDANFLSLNTLRLRAYEHDYFTSALPFAQKGSPVTIPLGVLQDLPIANNVLGGGITEWPADIQGNPGTIEIDNIDSPNPAIPAGQIFADASNAVLGATTINDLRRAEQLQKFLERDAVGGTRYTESVYAHFGIKNPDSRLQRPEYITGVKQRVVISEVLNTSDTATVPQGNMSGHGVSYNDSKMGSYFATEHGWILGLATIMPRASYQQGIDRMYGRIFDRYQYYWPEFAHIGEQEVLNKEIFAFQGTVSEDTFGYQSRYSEYKYMSSKTTGEFQTTLGFWTNTRVFTLPPQLNANFIEVDGLNTGIFAAGATADYLWMHHYNKVYASRLMPVFGTPMM